VVEACTLAVAASEPYSKQTLVGRWEAAYPVDNALVACMVRAYMVDQEGASQASWVVQDNRKDMVYRHSHGLPPGLPRTRVAAWVAGQEVPCGEIAVADCVGAEGTIVYSACRYMATRPQFVWRRGLYCA